MAAGSSRTLTAMTGQLQDDKKVLLCGEGQSWQRMAHNLFLSSLHQFSKSPAGLELAEKEGGAIQSQGRALRTREELWEEGKSYQEGGRLACKERE